jgi:hypothetical protein
MRQDALISRTQPRSSTSRGSARDLRPSIFGAIVVRFAALLPTEREQTKVGGAGQKK